MNIRILTISLMALCLLSCSSSKQDDPIIPDPDDGKTSIAFGGNSGTWQDAPTSRATRATGLETLFTTFRVWGYKTTGDNTTQTVMNGYTVAHATDWDYVGINNQTIKYWDYSASNYRFFAYTPADASITTTENNTFNIPYTYSPTATATDVPYISELWFADNTQATHPYGSCVTLTFSPLIAKVRFKFTYPDGTDAITVKDIQFRDSRFVDTPSAADTPLSGTLTTTYPLTGIPPTATPDFGWAPSTDTDSKGQLLLTIPYEDASDAIHILNDPTQYNKWYYVPPLSTIGYEQGPYTVNARINGKESAATVPSQFMQWKAGYQYTYIFKITNANNDITFADLQVEQWLPGTGIENKGSGTEGW